MLQEVAAEVEVEVGAAVPGEDLVRRLLLPRANAVCQAASLRTRAAF